MLCRASAARPSLLHRRQAKKPTARATQPSQPQAKRPFLVGFFLASEISFRRPKAPQAQVPASSESSRWLMKTIASSSLMPPPSKAQEPEISSSASGIKKRPPTSA